MESSVALKLKALSKTEQWQFLSLHNNFPGKHLVSGFVKTNALPCGSGSATGESTRSSTSTTIAVSQMLTIASTAIQSTRSSTQSVTSEKGNKSPSLTLDATPPTPDAPPERCNRLRLHSLLSPTSKPPNQRRPPATPTSRRRNPRSGSRDEQSR